MAKKSSKIVYTFDMIPLLISSLISFATTLTVSFSLGKDKMLEKSDFFFSHLRQTRTISSHPQSQAISVPRKSPRFLKKYKISNSITITILYILYLRHPLFSLRPLPSLCELPKDVQGPVL
jgi:hypothetical protein